MSRLMDRHPYEAWTSLGRPTMYINAREKVEAILAAPPTDALSDEVLKTLDEILAVSDKELAAGE